MKIEYTPRYIKDYSNIKDARAKKDTDKVERLINTAPNFVELHKLLDIKKYDPGLGGYRIRYSNKPEWRIRFELIDDTNNPKEKVVKLQMVLPREKYEKYAHISINESIETPFKIIISESQYIRLMEDLNNPMDDELTRYSNRIPPSEVGEVTYRYKEGRNTVPDRMDFDTQKLIDCGAIVICKGMDGDPNSPTFKKHLNDGSTNLITLYNIEHAKKNDSDSWILEAIKHPVTVAPKSWENMSLETYDGKYNQILWSLKKLGIPYEDVIK